MTTAIAQMPVTIQPVDENLSKILSTLVPVLKKKFVNIFICDRIANSAINMTIIMSTARSVTTVPKAFGNCTLSYWLNTPQRANSPTRGTTRLTA